MLTFFHVRIITLFQPHMLICNSKCESEIFTRGVLLYGKLQMKFSHVELQVHVEKNTCKNISFAVSRENLTFTWGIAYPIFTCEHL